MVLPRCLLTGGWSWLRQLGASLVQRVENVRQPYLKIDLPTYEALWRQQERLKTRALALTIYEKPQARPGDHQIVDEYRTLQEFDPTRYNAARLYEELLGERAEAELMQAQVTAGVWWKLATPDERATWIARARELENQKELEQNDLFKAVSDNAG
jgi:hypothetical protein